MRAFLFLLRTRKWVLILLVSLLARMSGGAGFSEWRQRQTFEVPAPGMIRVSLPAATLDVLRPGLEDLRVVDSAGNALPFLVRRPEPEPPPVRAARSFKGTLRGNLTVLEIETGLEVPYNALTLDTPERAFIKPVRLEGSQDGRRFVTILEGAPIFRQPGASELSLRFSPGVWGWLRVTIDDQRTPAIPFTGARLQAAAAVDVVTEPVAATIKAREEIDGDTRLVVDLGSANLTLATVEVETPEALFQREIIARIPTMVNEEIHETEARRGVIYALDASGVKTPRQTTLTLDRQVRARELVLLIRNLDSPPLALTGIRATRRPAHLLFQARDARPHFLYAGNLQCSAPHYDLTGLAAGLVSAAAADVVLGNLIPNPDYRAPEALPGLTEIGAALDTKPWRYRKRVSLTRPGAQQLELDLEVLAQASPDFSDLRLVREGKQVPYLIQRTSLTRAINPAVESFNDPKEPRLSRWKVVLPQVNLPVTRLECRSRTGLFQRSVRVWEELPDQRGGQYRSELGRADWQHTDATKDAVLTLELTRRPETDRLVLETDNGDNPAIDLDRFRLTYPVTQLVFKGAELVDLYYGQPTASAPRYDLRLVAGQLLSAEKTKATLGTQEILKPGGRLPGRALTGVGGWVFWSVLGLVTVGLIFVVVRLLPAPPAGSAPNTAPKSPEQK